MTSPEPSLGEHLADYSPLSFLRRQRANLAEHQAWTLLESDDPGLLRFGSDALAWVRRLEWDTKFFGWPMYRLEFAVTRPDREGIGALATTLIGIRRELAAANETFYLSAEVPAEDVVVLQALGLAGFGLVETRLTYFRDDVRNFSWPRRFAVRPATPADIGHLRAVAVKARNPYDRYHADPFFDVVADDYLAKFVEASVMGFADIVLVPDDASGDPPGAFVTARITTPPACPLGRAHDCPIRPGIGQFVLGADTRQSRGLMRTPWSVLGMAEMLHLFRERSLGVAWMTTQASNRPMIRAIEMLGCRYGRAAHVLATSARGPARPAAR
jgi:hypothetical protein